MVHKDFKEGITFTVFTLLAAIAILTSIITFQYPHSSHNNYILSFFIINHLPIMLLTILLSIAYGFYLSRISKKQLHKEEETTKDILKIVINFLGQDEKKVLSHLLHNDGISTQSKIAHVDNMGNVKSLRTVKRMSEKGIISIIKEGKVRRVILDKKITILLKNKEV